MIAVADRGRELDDWLQWQESLHPRSIDLGLERVRTVARRLHLLPFPARCITVAGTNGKGSSALILGEILSLNQCVGVYTSPYLLRYNERIQINGEPVGDDDLCLAFAEVEAARGDTSLTYFEFGTLAALWLFRHFQVDVAVLEVGMGGRLDAVNIVDAHAVLITSIGLDHVDWLGHDRESIALEKAGVFRPGQVAVCADRNPPQTMLERADALGLQLHRIGSDFDLEEKLDELPVQWLWRDWCDNRCELAPPPHLLRDNLAGVLAVLAALDALPAWQTLQTLVAEFSVPGRRQLIDGEIPQVLDVAHNLEAMQMLMHWLAERPVSGRTHFVLGMLANKPVEAIGPLLASHGLIYAGGLPGVDRGLSADQLASRLGVASLACQTVVDALTAARCAAVAGDRIVVCGSFHTLAAVMRTQGHSSEYDDSGVKSEVGLVDVGKPRGELSE